MPDDDPKPENTEKPARKPRQGTGEWAREMVTSTISLVVSREQENDKKDTRVLYIVAGFGLLGWLGFLVLGGHEIVTRVNTQTGEAEFRANGRPRAEGNEGADSGGKP